MEEQKIYRYPGLKPFSVTERNIFFGRKEDTRRLHQNVKIENQVVLHARSGLGKSSLLNAGLIPSLMEVGKFQPIRVRFGAYSAQNSPDLIDQVYQHIAENSSEPSYLSKVGTAKGSLWYAAKCAEAAAPDMDTFVLIFDQFEEVFTYPRAMINRFKKELADLLHKVIPRDFRDKMEKGLAGDAGFLSDEEIRKIYEPLDIKAIYAIRSDKLSLVDQFKDVIPEILTRTYELSALTRAQSEDAILNPAYQKGDQFQSSRFDFTDEAIDAILAFLTKDGESEVESFQLQVICQYAENIVIRQKKKEVTRADLGEISNIFENYYEDLIRQLPTEDERSQARKLIEEGLILEEDEIRLSLHEGQVQRDFGISEDLLQKLVNTRLVRRESSPRGGFVYELSHDTLIKPILKSRTRRLFAEQDALQRQEARKAQRRFIATVITLIFMTVGAFAALFFANWAWEQKKTAEELKEKAVADKLVIEDQKQQLDSLILVIDTKLAEREKAIEQEKDSLETQVAMQSPRAQQQVKKQEESLDADLKQIKVLRQDLDKVIDDKRTNKRPEYVAKLFSSNERVRKASVNALVKNWISDPQLAVELVEYCNSHFDNDTGIFNALYVLEQMDAEVLQQNKEAVADFLTKLEEEKQYRASTTSRMERIRTKLG